MEQEIHLKQLEREFLHHEYFAEYEQEELKNIFVWLIEHYFNLNKTDLLLGKKVSLNTEHIQNYYSACRRLNQGEPIQYILGYTDFLDCKIKVNEKVLIPRPETEILVDWLISDADQFSSDQLIVDLGTGSGCIAVAVAKSLKNPVLAVDISESALFVAKRNARLNKVKVDVMCLDINRLKVLKGQPEVIISNPPYVLQTEKNQLNSNVIGYEPHLALFSNTPIQYYQSIFEYVKTNKFVKYVYLELNHLTAEKVADLFKSIRHESLTIRKDMRGNKRFLKWVRS